MVLKNFCTIKVLLVTSAALLVVLSAVLALAFFGIPLIIEDQVHKSVRLEDGTIQWDRFVELPFGMDFKVWLFNVTNPEEILTGSKPVLKEVGPYHYSQYRWKEIISTNDAEDTVTFQQHMNMTFREDLSGVLRNDDELTLVNPIILIMSQITTPLERMVIGGCLHKIFKEEYNQLFIKIKVQTILFDGLEFAVNSEDVGVACGIIRNKFIEKTAIIKNVANIYANGDEETAEIHSLKFAYFQYKVDKPDGIYTTIRGMDDISKLGNIIRWNSDTTLPYWGRMQSTNNETCQKVRGTDSTLYPPYITTDGTFEIFATDICRVVKINYKSGGTYKGISGYSFEPDETTLRSATPSAENDCYCTKESSDENGNPSCFLDGLVDVKPCIGAPVLLSFPHFLYADEKYINGIDGVSPANKSIHGIYLLVEPNTGTPLEGKKRVQLNVVLRPASFMKITEKLPRVTIPLIWIEEGVSLPQEYIDELGQKYFSKVKLADGIKYALIAVTAAAVATSIGFLARKTFFTRK